ncbi:MAG TPA: T9SS type A sorting domain-containing protein [Rhodothermales bacterium]|nr:T9SS type A sorting domain-containing protein [Rhodothermales bacterium]
MKTRVRLLVIAIGMSFSGISYAQEALLVDAEVWLVTNVYWAKLEMIAQSNIWDPDRNYLSSPNVYEYSVVSGSPQSTDFFMNFDPIQGGCLVGGCFSYAKYQIKISWKTYSYSNVNTRSYYINYLDANINEDYAYQSNICGIDVIFDLAEDVITMSFKGGFPTCGGITTTPPNGASYQIWQLTGPDSYTPNSARHFNIPTAVTTSCGGSACNPNRIYEINGSSPPQDPCPASGCSITMQSENTLTAEAYSFFENYDPYGDMVFYYWKLPNNTYLHGINPFSSPITRSLYTNLAIPLTYEAYYSYDWNPPHLWDPAKVDQKEQHEEKSTESKFVGEEGSELSASSFPNPFNPTTTITYQILESSHVSLIIYDLLGRRVARLTDGWQEAGQYEVTWDASALPSGLYLYRLEAAGQGVTGKIQLYK